MRGTGGRLVGPADGAAAAGSDRSRLTANGPPSLGEGGPSELGIGQGDVIRCAGESTAEESTIELPKPPSEIRSNCLTSRPAVPVSHGPVVDWTNSPLPP